MARTIEQLEEELKKAKETEKNRKREKQYITSSTRVLFGVMALAFMAFFVCFYLCLKLSDTALAGLTLDKIVWFSAPVLTALIIKSGFENVSKGRIRGMIVKSHIGGGNQPQVGAEDFRNSI